MAKTPLRWKLAEDEDASGQGALFPEEDLVDRHVGTGEFRGLEFLHVKAKRIINEVPSASQVPFRWTINAYRGCSHACAYCLGGDTPILMADGRTRRLADLSVGDMVYGTERRGRYRRYFPTEVLAHWSTVKPAYRVTLEDGTELIASGDHRFLTDRGWKYVTDSARAGEQRPHITTNNRLVGVGGFATSPEHDVDYQTGYVCGMMRGDGAVGSYTYQRKTGSTNVVYRVRLALRDFEALRRTQLFLESAGVTTTEFVFAEASGAYSAMNAIRTSRRAHFERVGVLSEWPVDPSIEWTKGFLAGVFDAEGSFSGSLRIANSDPEMIDQVVGAFERLGFRFVVERARNRNMAYVRLVGGVREHLRFFHSVDPAITRKRTINDLAVKCKARTGVVAVEPLGLELPMYDITTGTGDFIANGVVSHNCFARPTHEYLGLDIGRDFDTKIVVKVNAVERLRAELAARRWAGDPIAMGTNTDPYQRCEGKYHLTQGIIKVLTDASNPFSILTKSTLILRDLKLLQEAAKRAEVHTSFSIGTLDEEVWKATEPGTPHPRQRVEAVRKLNEAGVPCGVLVAPVIPGMSDRPEQVEEVVRACVDAGATSVSPIYLHLRKGVRDHWLNWVANARPDLLDEHRRRYARSYLPKPEQSALSQLVKRTIDDARG